MLRTSIRNLVLLLAGTCLVSPVLALGPVDGEIGTIWWAGEVRSDDALSGYRSDAGAPGYRAELWFVDRYGLRAGLYESDPDAIGRDSSTYTSLDLLWRPLSVTENNYLAVGAGWQEMDLAGIGLSGDTSGVRLNVEGRVALIGLVYAYGQGSYMPAMDDAPAGDPLLGRFEEISAQELEAGVAWKMFPFVSMRAGYRNQQLDYTRRGFVPLPGGPTEIDGSTETDGWLLGLTFNF